MELNELLKKAAAEMGRKGGHARAAVLTPERRAEIARLGGLASKKGRKKKGKGKK